jgi:cytochrome c553
MRIRAISNPAAQAGALLLAAALAGPASAQTVFVHQGADWTPAKREAFYTQDQGSRIMPLAWMQALSLPDGTPFMDASLARYGYLPNPTATTPDVPVGFTVANEAGVPSIGMTCSACHTRQIDVSGTQYRIDGGPAVVDFQPFLADLDAAVKAVLASDAAFDAFAEAVLGSGATQADKATLRIEVETWEVRFGTLVERSLPDPAWGPSRLDAVSMIFNRLAGLDLGEAPTYLIEENIVVADAPTRYPFLWNAARQDKTQWPGFADNGNDILGLSRNLGEVYGVFAIFHPVKQSGFLKLDRDYLTNNSANFTGLRALETLIWDIGPPQWPWEVDHALAAQGAQIFDRATADGGCVACHGITRGAFRSPFHETWATPVLDVGTDARECAVLARTVKTGVLEGAKIPFGTALGATDTAFNVLATSVIGAIIQDYTSGVGLTLSTLEADARSLEESLPEELKALEGAFPSGAETKRLPGEGSGGIVALSLATAPAVDAPAGQPTSGCAYESRVLQGIWAAAPYLHNGSVQSLAELLKPAAERAASFPLGPAYDIEAVGLAAEQTRFDYVLETTGCDDLSSGNSRCGHEYGTDLSDTEKAALLEYLKTL